MTFMNHHKRNALQLACLGLVVLFGCSAPATNHLSSPAETSPASKGSLQATAPSDASAVDLEALAAETRQEFSDGGRHILVMWMPEEQLKVQLDAYSYYPPEVGRACAVLRDYVVIVVIEVFEGPFGGISYTTPDELAHSTVLVDAHGRRYKPLSQDAISEDARELARQAGPDFMKALGPEGKNVAILFFPSSSPEGASIADAMNAGEFAVVVDDHAFAWTLPLIALLPPQFCPRDGKPYRGSNKFCPDHGDRLVAYLTGILQREKRFL